MRIVRCGSAPIFAMLLLAACADCPTATTFSAIKTEILQRTCVFSSCHSQTGARAAGNLNLSLDPYNALVNHGSDNALAKAQGLKRVLPFDPEHSFLVVKLRLPVDSTADGGYQESMPQGNPHLPDCNIAGILAWIAAGAQND